MFIAPLIAQPLPDFAPLAFRAAGIPAGPSALIFLRF
jgi:hypothetical protein